MPNLVVHFCTALNVIHQVHLIPIPLISVKWLDLVSCCPTSKDLAQTLNAGGKIETEFIWVCPVS